MPLRPTIGRKTPASPSKERRLERDARLLQRLARAVQGWMRRPIGVYRVDGRWRAGLVERRRVTDEDRALRAIVDDLQERLLVQDPDVAADRLGQLLQVHDRMRRKGWAGVAALPEAVRARALIQARVLARATPSAPMTMFIDRLGASRSAPTMPERTSAAGHDGGFAHDPAALEVSELSPDEFEASQRGWLDTMPPLHATAPATREP